jgi:hypothetical protein
MTITFPECEHVKCLSLGKLETEGLQKLPTYLQIKIQDNIQEITDVLHRIC